jgi:capsular exopolysaccharide synthesis family protein
MATFDVAFDKALAKSSQGPTAATARGETAQTPLEQLFQTVERFEFDPTKLVIAASVVGEQYKTLKTNLARFKEMEGIGSFVFSSSMKDEGKTTVVLNTARAFGQERGLKVAVVDCDFKRPGIADACRVQCKEGFEKVVAGSAALRDCGIYSKKDNFVVFAIKGRGEETADSLAVNKIETVIGELESMFDVILFDTSPVLSTTEPLVLGARTGGVVLVVRANSTQRESVIYAQGQLEQAGCRLLGVVLNARPSYVPRFWWLRKYDYFQEEYTYRKK